IRCVEEQPAVERRFLHALPDRADTDRQRTTRRRMAVAADGHHGALVERAGYGDVEVTVDDVERREHGADHTAGVVLDFEPVEQHGLVLKHVTPPRTRRATAAT